MGQTLAVAGQRITASLLNRMYGQADATSHTVTAAALADLSSVYVIAANDAAVSTAYRLTAFGQGTWGSTQQNLVVQATLGSTSLGSATVASTVFSISTAFRWHIQLDLVVATTGSSGSAVGALKGSLFNTGTGTQASSPVACGGSVTMNTTIANNFKLQANWASTTGAPTLTCLATMFERVN